MKKSTLLVLEKGNDSAITGPLKACCLVNIMPLF